ncbi:response regulator [Oleidesulfovibrio sp.]|uniref:hybrid sensor histidine kinase/response regulator n=1 Tax=Oleidesulfovibrio sp. TaxID=2909707 RepID=UPI003A854B65
MKLFRQYPLLLSSIAILFLLLLGLGAAMVGTLLNQAELNNKLYMVSEERSVSLHLADELRKSSDELTRMVRMYAVTGDVRYLQYFNIILDIRDGLLAEPEGYDGIFWDYIVASDDVFLPVRKPGVSMTARLHNAGVKAEEFALLNSAKGQSDALVELERQAVNIIRSSGSEYRGEKRSQAIDILHGKEYLKAKKGIMQSIDMFVSRLEDRTSQEVNTVHKELTVSNTILFYLFATFIVVFPVLVIVGSIFHKNVSNSLRMLVEQKDSEIKSRRKVQEELARSKSNLEVTLNSIGDAVISTDTEGRIVQINPAGRALTKLAYEEALGALFDQKVKLLDAVSKEEAKPTLRQIMASKEPVVGQERILVVPGGDELVVKGTGAPILDQTGNVKGAVVVFRDITEERQMQARLLHSSKMEAVGQLAGGVAHDFNNMLGAIFSSVEILKRRVPEDEKIEKYIDLILEAAKRAADLTRNLLTFARKQPKLSTAINIHESVKAVVDILKETVDKRINIRVNTTADSSYIIGDQTLIQSALMNLGINASHAMEKGGTLTIETRNIGLDEVDTKVGIFKIAPGEYIEITVQDTGKGIPQEVLPHIFEPFFTTKEKGKGSGLGLASTFGTIKQHLGAIYVYSEVGIGTTFRILLPLAESYTLTTEVESEEEVIGTGRILLVDDEELMRVTGHTLLTDMGYDVVLASDGQQALEVFKEQQGAFDLVIMDMVMPRMDGRDCFRELKKVDPDVCVVLSSGFTQESDLAEVKKLGLAGFINKPYLRSALHKAVQTALKEKARS